MAPSPNPRIASLRPFYRSLFQKSAKKGRGTPSQNCLSVPASGRLDATRLLLPTTFFVESSRSRHAAGTCSKTLAVKHDGYIANTVPFHMFAW